MFIEDSKSEPLIEYHPGSDAAKQAQQGSGQYIQRVMYTHVYLRIGNKTRPKEGEPHPFFEQVTVRNKEKGGDAKMIGGVIGDKTVAGTAVREQ